METKVTVKFEGEGLVPALRLQNPDGTFEKLSLEDGTASVQLQINIPHKLFWLIVGAPETKFKITLSTGEGFKIKANRNPINGKIPSGSAGFGRERFLVERS